MKTVKPRVTIPMRIARFALRLFGWRVVNNLPPTNKYILVGAWHTSNWDFLLAVFAMWGMGVKLNFLGKQELIDGKLGWLMKRFGVIGVDRGTTVNLVESMAEVFAERKELRLVVAAEGTRSHADYWKTGFYYMAKAANVPVAFSFIDSAAKEVGIDGYFIPSDDRDKDFHKIKLFYASKRGLKPHKQGTVKFKELEPVTKPVEAKEVEVQEVVAETVQK